LKRIAFISSNKSAWGGSEYLWYKTALKFSENNFDVLVSVPRWKIIPGQLEDLRRKSIPLYFNTDSSSFKKLFNRFLPSSMQFDYRNDGYESIKKFSPDLTVINQGGNTGGADIMEYCISEGLKFVTISQAANEAKWPDDKLNKKLSEFFPRSEMNYFVSKANLNLTQIQTGQDILNSEIIFNPFNVSYNVNLPYPDDTENYNMANVARHEFYAKGQDILFQVLNEKKWRERNLTVNLFGKGEHSYQVKKLKDYFKLDKINIKGHKDPEEIWKENHALILSSRYEGLPLALVEAMLCRRVSVVTDVSGNREAVTDGINGFLAAAAVPSLLDEAMERAWNRRNEWKQLGEAAGKDIRKKIPEDPVEYFYKKLKAID